MENIATHKYTKDGIICLKNDVLVMINYTLMGNWLISNHKIKNINCCEVCSTNHTIYTNAKIASYDEDHIYFTDNTYIKYENNKLIKIDESINNVIHKKRNVWEQYSPMMANNDIEKYCQEDEKARESMRLLAKRLANSST